MSYVLAHNLRSPGENVDLLHRACVRLDKEAQNELVLAYMPLVVRLASKVTSRGKDVGDLVGEGALALVECAQRFNPKEGKGNFGAYARMRVRGAIRNYENRTGLTVRLDTFVAGRKVLAGYRAAHMRFGGDLAAIAAHLGISVERAQVGTYLLAGDAPMSLGSPDPSIASETPEDDCIEKQQTALVIEAVRAFGGSLVGLERTVFRERLCNESPPSQSELAARLGITQRKVSRVECALRARMREELACLRPD